MKKFEIISSAIFDDMSEEEAKEELIILLTLESDAEKLIHINTMTKKIVNKFIRKTSI